MLSAYADWLRATCLDELAVENLARVRRLDVPLMRLFETVPEAQLLAQVRVGLAKFLDSLVDGTALSNTATGLEQWERDELPGLRKDDVEPGDLVLVAGAQRQSMLLFLGRYSSDPTTILAVVQSIEEYYLNTQHQTLQVFARIRLEAGARAARLELEKQAVEAHSEELSAANEELSAANEELTSLYGQLQAQTEELESQAEELREQQDELTHANDSLRSTERWLHGVIESAPVGLIVLEMDGTVRLAEGRAMAGVVAPGTPLVGRKVFDVFEGSQGLLDDARRALAGEELVALHEFQAGLPYETRWTPLRGPEGHPQGLLMVAVDVRERLEAEERRQQIESLRQADVLKDQFLSILSHELRTPINAIMGFGSILDDGLAGELSGLQHEYLQKMLMGADSLLSLVNDLLDMSRIQAGKFSLDPQPLDLPSVITSVAASLAPLAEQKLQQLSVDLPKERLPALLGDEQRLVQVLVNLVNNAIKFTPERGSIKIRAFRDTRSVHCEVVDTGGGISPENVPKLFQRFSQVDGSNTREAGGTGLGLSIAKALVEAHGGQIGVSSVPGQGSTFWFSLPLQALNLTEVEDRHHQPNDAHA